MKLTYIEGNIQMQAIKPSSLQLQFHLHQQKFLNVEKSEWKTTSLID